MFEKLGFKNITSSKTIGFLTLLLILLEGLFLFPINLPYFNVVRYFVLGFFLILLLYFLLDYTIDKKVLKSNKELSDIIVHLKKENQRLYKLQSTDLIKFNKWKNETMAENKYNKDTGTQTK